jgi:hypothetical protein
MLETVRTSETSVYFNETTRRCVQKAVISIRCVYLKINCSGKCIDLRRL